MPSFIKSIYEITNLMSKIQKFIVKLLVIIILSFVWTFLIPLIAAQRDKVFSSDDLEKKVPPNTVVFTKLQVYKTKIDVYEKIIKATDEKIVSISNDEAKYGEVESLLKIKESYEKKIAGLKTPVKIVPFIESGTMYYYVALTIFLSFCVFLIRPNISKTEINKKKQLGWLIGIFVFTAIVWIAIQSNSWGRCINAFDEKRNVVSFSHCGISTSTFLLQQAHVWTIALLVILLCRLWIVFYDENVEKIKDWDNGKNEKWFNMNEFTNRTHYVIDMFNLWQMNIIVLVIAYLPWTFIYWNKEQDSRFNISAIVLHFGWVILWGLISAPMIYTFNKWTVYKFHCLAFLVSNDSKDKEKDKITGFVKDANPLSNIQIIGASLASIISLLLPIINLLIKM